MASGQEMSALAHRTTLERVLRFVAVANPAPGAGWSFKIPGESVARVLGVTGRLTTSVAAVNRQPTLLVGDGSATFMAFSAFANVAASLAPLVSFVAPGATGAGSAVGGVITSALSELVLPAGYTLTMTTTLLDAADQWSQCVVLYEELLAMPLGVRELQEANELSELYRTSAAAEGI